MKTAKQKPGLAEEIRKLCLELHRTRRALAEVQEALVNLEEIALLEDDVNDDELTRVRT